MAVKGRFLAASAVYPHHSWLGLLNFFKACMVALPSKALTDVEGDRLTTCAFCLRTSAGVRMKHDTSSPIEDATEWMTGVGINRALLAPIVGFRRWRRLFVPSYVVKNAPAKRWVS